MAEYISTVIIAGITGALTTFLCPDGESGSGKYVKYLSSFVMLLVILAPLRNISTFVSAVKNAADSISSGDVEVSEGADLVPALELTAENIADYIRYICDKEYGIPADEIKVKLLLNEEDLTAVEIDEVQLYTPERTREKRDAVKAYFEELLSCRVYVFGP